VGNVVSRGNRKTGENICSITTSSTTKLIRETYGIEPSLVRLYEFKGGLRQKLYPDICWYKYLAG